MKIIVKGNPKALTRHRRVFRGGKTWEYDPSKKDKDDFLWQVMNKAPKTPFKGALSIKAHFYMKRPKNHFRSGKYSQILKDTAPVRHIVKPDADNYLKFVFDALEGVFYKNDSQICVFSGTKTYSRDPRTEITIEEI